MADEMISLEDYFKDVLHPDECCFTVHRIKESPDRVRLTPVFPGGSCLCHCSFVVEAKQIKGIKVCGTHRCCGRQYPLTRVLFVENASIPLSELFKQVAEHAAKRCNSRRGGNVLRMATTGVGQELDDDDDGGTGSGSGTDVGGGSSGDAL